MILCYPTLCTISAHRLEVLSLTGNIGEFVRLVQKVESASWAPKWLSSLQSSRKTTLALMLQATVQTRLEEGTRKLCVQSNFRYDLGVAWSVAALAQAILRVMKPGLAKSITHSDLAVRTLCLNNNDLTCFMSSSYTFEFVFFFQLVLTGSLFDYYWDSCSASERCKIANQLFTALDFSLILSCFLQRRSSQYRFWLN